MRRLLITSGLFSLLAASALDASAQMATVDFESLVLGTTFGNASGDSPGDLAFTEDGVDVRLQNFTEGGFVGFIEATVGGFTDDDFPTTPMTIGNISLEFDFTNLPFDVGVVTFEYADFGGSENLGVNGSVVELGQLTDAPAVLGGATVTVTPPMGASRIGTVALVGDIDTLLLGGQEFGVDNIKAVVPEPSSALLACGLASLAWGSRRGGQEKVVCR